jgi:hypothetical protein
MSRQWLEFVKNAKSGRLLGVETVAMFETFDGLTRLFGAGKLAVALDLITIHPELFVQVVAGMVKFPL